MRLRLRNNGRGLFRCFRLASRLGPGLLAPEADLLGERRALGGIIRSDHGVIGWQPPFRAIFFGRQAVSGAQVTLEHLQFLAVFEADDIVGLDRAADRNCGFLLILRRFRRVVVLRAQTREDRLNHVGNLRSWNFIVADIGRSNLGRHSK